MFHEFKKQARKGGSRCLYIILRSHIITLNTIPRLLRFSPSKPVCAKSSCSGHQEGPGKGVNPGPSIWGGSAAIVISLTLASYPPYISPASRKTPNFRYGKLPNASGIYPGRGNRQPGGLRNRHSGRPGDASLLRKYAMLTREKATFIIHLH